MTTPQPNESIIITLDELSTHCFEHWLLGFNQAIHNLTKIGQEMAMGREQVKAQMMAAFVNSRNTQAVAQAMSQVKEESSKSPDVSSQPAENLHPGKI